MGAGNLVLDWGLDYDTVFARLFYSSITRVGNA